MKTANESKDSPEEPWHGKSRDGLIVNILRKKNQKNDESHE